MAQSVDDVLIGTGDLYVAAKGTAFPSDPSTTPASDWVHVGYSEDGWTFEIDRTFEDIMVAEEIDPIDIYKTAQTINLSGELAQATLENLKYAMSGGTITEDAVNNLKTFVPPTTAGFTEWSIMLRVQAPGGGGGAADDYVREVQIPRAVAVGAIQMAHQKAPSKTLVAAQFRLLVPASTSANGTDIFKIVDETA